jgi:hypothetical protein
VAAIARCRQRHFALIAAFLTARVQDRWPTCKLLGALPYGAPPRELSGGGKKAAYAVETRLKVKTNLAAVNIAATTHARGAEASVAYADVLTLYGSLRAHAFSNSAAAKRASLGGMHETKTVNPMASASPKSAKKVAPKKVTSKKAAAKKAAAKKAVAKKLRPRKRRRPPRNKQKQASRHISQNIHHTLTRKRGRFIGAT